LNDLAKSFRAFGCDPDRKGGGEIGIMAAKDFEPVRCSLCKGNKYSGEMLSDLRRTVCSACRRKEMEEEKIDDKVITSTDTA